ncbi:MAG: acyl-CoA dehydrogenase family protein [Gammaproteobacteria bacterium]
MPEEFFQAAPNLGNQYREDPLLRRFLAWRLPQEALAAIASGLDHLGERVVGDILCMAEDAEQNPPRLIHVDPWGQRVDRIQTAWGWKALHRVSAEEGLVAVAYERGEGVWSRVHQMARLYLFHASSAMYSCPLAMTDGAARVIEIHGDEALLNRPFKRFTTREPDDFWTSGQWMTERSGGSDVGGSTTEAHLTEGNYRLYGAKWFTSATTAEAAMVLAKIAGDDRLSLFYLETRDGEGRLNGIEIQRLKDKLGTRAMPTAELRLHGAVARLVGEPGKGVRTIATLLNITRLYNAVAAVSYMRRGIALARDYAGKRQAFGKRLSEHPLHLETLARLEVEFQAAFHLTFHLGLLAGKSDLSQASESEQAVLRLLVPVVKLFTAKQAVAVLSEAIECFGGAGYVEDTGLPRLLRDCQVLPIWEGTTNILSLDVLRVLREPGVFAHFSLDLEARLHRIEHPSIDAIRERIAGSAARLGAYLQWHWDADSEAQESGARPLAFAIARITAAALMAEFADWALKRGQDDARLSLNRWCAEELALVLRCDQGYRQETRQLALGAHRWKSQK